MSGVSSSVFIKSMAGNNLIQETTEAEIEQLKASYPDSVRVISDMGDFKYIVNVKTPIVALKFQIDSE